MYLPSSYSAALFMMLAGMIFWGSWANTYKLTGNLRIELFYLDYAFGIFLSSIAIGLTLGTLFGPVSFVPQLMAADRISWLYACAAGALWNCGNVLLMFGVSMVGLAVAFPLSIGLALILGVIGSYLVMPRGNPALLFAGVAVVFAAILFNSLAYQAAARTKQKPSTAGLFICISAGVLFSGFGPLVGKALSTHTPLGPYGVTFFFTTGALISTFPLMTYFMRNPLQGTALRWADYRNRPARQHAFGFLGGFLWSLGTTFTFVPTSMVGIALAYAIGQANPLVAAFWGVCVWREFKGTGERAHVLLALMFLCYLVGLSLLASSIHGR